MYTYHLERASLVVLQERDEQRVLGAGGAARVAGAHLQQRARAVVHAHELLLAGHTITELWMEPQLASGDCGNRNSNWTKKSSKRFRRIPILGDADYGVV